LTQKKQNNSDDLKARKCVDANRKMVMMTRKCADTEMKGRRPGSLWTENRRTAVVRKSADATTKKQKNDTNHEEVTTRNEGDFNKEQTPTPKPKKYTTKSKTQRRTPAQQPVGPCETHQHQQGH
jgi:hypothetical protein